MLLSHGNERRRNPIYFEETFIGFRWNLKKINLFRKAILWSNHQLVIQWSNNGDGHSETGNVSFYLWWEWLVIGLFEITKNIESHESFIWALEGAYGFKKSVNTLSIMLQRQCQAVSNRNHRHVYFWIAFEVFGVLRTYLQWYLLSFNWTRLNVKLIRLAKSIYWNANNQIKEFFDLQKIFLPINLILKFRTLLKIPGFIVSNQRNSMIQFLIVHMFSPWNLQSNLTFKAMKCLIDNLVSQN